MTYRTPDRFRAFSVGKDGDFPLTDDGSFLPPSGAWGVALPRQVHSANVVYVKDAGRPADTDAVFTDVPGLCVAVKTADCIPVLLYARAGASRRGGCSCRMARNRVAHNLPYVGRNESSRAYKVCLGLLRHHRTRHITRLLLRSVTRSMRLSEKRASRCRSLRSVGRNGI